MKRSMIAGLMLVSTFVLPQETIVSSDAVAAYKEGVSKVEANDTVAGMKLIEQSADAGYSEAQKLVGIIYNNGNLVKRDMQKALKYYKLAAGQGNKDVITGISSIYLEQHNIKAAFPWAKKAADNGDVQSMSFVGMVYLNGKVVPKNEAAGLNYLKNAARKGDKDAIDVMNALHQAY